VIAKDFLMAKHFRNWLVGYVPGIAGRTRPDLVLEVLQLP